MKRIQNPTRIMFFLYFCVLIWTVLFKMSVSLEEIRCLAGARTLNLIPFDYRAGIPRILIREAAMNVLIFIPLGCYLKMLGLSGGEAVVYGGLTSLAMEMIQLLLAIGVSDITDLLTNTMGTAIGVGFRVLVSKICADNQKADRYINTAAAMAILLFFMLMLILMMEN